MHITPVIKTNKIDGHGKKVNITLHRIHFYIWCIYKLKRGWSDDAREDETGSKIYEEK